MLEKFIGWLKDNPVAAVGSAIFALGATWVGQQVSNLFEHAAYSWILDQTQRLFADREAILIASAASYLPGIITGAVVFIAVFWIWTHADRDKALLKALGALVAQSAPPTSPSQVATASTPPQGAAILDLEERLDSPTKPVPIGEALYVGNIHANTAFLAAEYFIELSIQAFN